MAAYSSKQAAAYLIDPLTAPAPSEETGPGTHFVPPASESSVPRNFTGSSTETNPYRRHQHTGSSGSQYSSHGRHSRHASTSSQPEKFPNYRAEAFGGLNEASPPSYDVAAGGSSGRRRTSSLKERFPGDDSHKPLDIIRRDSKKASRSPHLNKRHMVGTDTIDRLDPSTKIPYHHEGPYDAASLARNSVRKNAPIDALKDSNAEALRATPPENIKDSLEHRVPLSGTAVVPPGMEDRFGRTFNYQEGANQMFEGHPEGGRYKQWEGVKYHPDDIKGKGEPSYSRDIAMREKEKRLSGHTFENDGGIEMSNTHSDRHSGGRVRSGSLTDGLKKRIGSLKKKHRDE
ncbi:hypothetical protein K461DRAFT_275929 [Myriangium duriaei CBS 260.36]|uniref:Pal1 cell morphology protein n=1 Tax=Myriangium duriaei CBS 260.36 TaxID=1168546 RepID=A0A9P4MM21_9PEZI|nr:hypothetical protein K461DRAFT_275929 [Myriangium duriaei CBS 260.36]